MKVNRAVTKPRRKIDRIADAHSAAELIVFDLEATCWEPEQPERKEILEIGAVRFTVHRAGSPITDIREEFSEIVRPAIVPDLSDFCRDLIPIHQEEAEAADAFPAVFDRFKRWLGKGKFWLGSWGAFDRRMLEDECRRHAVRLPTGFCGHIDLRREIARWMSARPASLADALAHAGLDINGTPHRALDDARNLARLARILLDHRAQRRTARQADGE